VKKQLWGGEFWTDGYYASTVGKHGNETVIGNYVKSQGKEYQQLHKDRQLMLF
jgi:REP element-mobilizing transposase RayT